MPVTAESSHIPPAASAAAAAGYPASPPLPAPALLRMPSIEGLGKCRLLRWLVEEGSPVAHGDVLCEIDSELAVIEYKAQSDGVLAIVRTGAGERISGEEQVLALQVENLADLQHADRWNAFLKSKELEEKKEIDAHEVKEEEAMQKELQREREEEAQQQQAASSSTSANSKPQATG